MTFTRLARIQTWLLRLFLITVLVLAAVIALGFQQGRLTTGKLSRIMGQMLAVPGLPRPKVAIIAGHKGSDSGATCEDGLMEVTITEELAQLVAEELRREGVAVEVLEEYDSALNGLKVDALLSIHVDSCVPFSGFKVASAEETVIPELDRQLVDCVQSKYGEITGLPVHPNTETSDMYGYHAFQQVDDSTPGAIIEVGFLGGDREFLLGQPEVAAHGITEGLICFLEDKYPRKDAEIDSQNEETTNTPEAP